MSRHSHFTDERAPMRYGHFDDAAKEYMIITPATPLPWINYLGNEDFFSLISDTGGGYSLYKDAKLHRITRYRYNNVPGEERSDFEREYAPLRSHIAI